MSELSEWVKVRHVLTFEQVFMRSVYDGTIRGSHVVPCADEQIREWERSFEGGIRELAEAVVEGGTAPVAAEVTVSAYDPRANSSPALDRLILERMASFGIAPNEAGQAVLEGPLAPLDKDAQG